METKKLRLVGWTLYILECADNTFFTGMTKDLKKVLIEINVFKKGIYFSKFPNRIPVKVIFQENNVPFREAYYKFSYMRQMNRYLKKKLIKTKKWPTGGPWKTFIEKNYITKT